MNGCESSQIHIAVLPKRKGLTEISIDGVDCWCRYETKTVFGQDLNATAQLSETWKIELPGGVVASVIRKPGSYGYEDGFCELAFLEDKMLRCSFVKLFSCEEDSEWGDDEVLGFLTETEVVNWLAKAVKKLSCQ